MLANHSFHTLEDNEKKEMTLHGRTGRKNTREN